MSEVDTAMTTTGFAACEKATRYVHNLVKHWGHKMPTSFDKESGIGVFPFDEHDNAVMTAMENGIAITLTTGGEMRNVELRRVIEKHIDRFAFREAPLSYEWREK